MIVTWRPEFVSEPRCSLLPHIRSAHLLPWIVPGVPGIPQDLPEFGLSLPSDRYSNDVRGCHGFRVATHNDDLTTRCRSPPTHISDSDPEASLSYDSTLPLHHNRPLPRGKLPDFRSTAPRTVLHATIAIPPASVRTHTFHFFHRLLPVPTGRHCPNSDDPTALDVNHQRPWAEPVQTGGVPRVPHHCAMRL